MYLDISQSRRRGKVYRRVLLRESFRDGGRVCKRTLANLSHVPAATIRALQWALRQPAAVPPAATTTGPLELRQGQSVGALAVVVAVAERLGLRAALGDERQGRLALYQVCARVLDQGSRLSAVRLARTQAVGELLDLGRFNEDTLYANLDWLAGRQAAIEDRLWRPRAAASREGGLFLYDVTSSYLEGLDNDLAAFGYNRDGKRGKKQIVVGLLTDQDGEPLSIELFPGNTADPRTVASQVDKLRARFGARTVTLVGDRGMLKLPQQTQLQAHGYHYITAISKPQIEALLRSGLLQLELFDETVAEVSDPARQVRYLLRRNPAQARLLAARRADQLATWQRHLQAWQARLAQRPRTRPATALKDLGARAQRLQLAAWLSVRADGRTLVAVADEAARAEAAKLDGCYALQTDLRPEQLGATAVDARYRELARVEWAFRTCKTAFLELRPIYLRAEARTRAHALVVMLAYRLTRHLADCWRAFDLTVEEGLQQLAQLCVLEVRVAGQPCAYRLPEPREIVAQLLAAAHVTLPASLPPRPAAVDTDRKLQSRRKKL